MAGSPDIMVRLLGVTKSYPQSDRDIRILDDITLDLYRGQYIALLGPSGSGKSTLLRIVTGLTSPSYGTVLYRNRPVTGPNPAAAMVFQTFALYPWLTVQQNVELGLAAKGVPAGERARRTAALIDLIGLDGYENAFPKELSGGMRQRVGFARALAVDPELLCMDEPFSALDFLTAENLRSELVGWWHDGRLPIQAVLMVTHGIEEAVYMADRIIILSKNPARVIADLANPLPYPRNRKSPAFLELTDQIYQIVTGWDRPPAAVWAVTEEPAKTALKPIPYGHLSMLSGLLELVRDRGGADDLYHLGAELFLEVDDLLPVTETAQLFHLADVKAGDIRLTPLGEEFVAGDIGDRKAIILKQLREIPLFQMIERVLRSKASHSMAKDFFLDILEEHFSPKEAERQLMTAINWGRFAELFQYDTDTELLFLEEDDPTTR
ncbi:ABC transporter related protein [Sulfobacillus acidophilus TPY]|uniref:Taurine-transporting ATPase n=1 Tax=Sulfobacillus acidophilus (strain ATCC 700253 / DSM 10332 / NAL) TaxID=679936 RepID=G8TV22_SULAD|nr:ABC transporter related protein [Sulfobacillus acidophilus TPY]AEW03603.1 Taurine-transporting ATPase [Sulfobacillus acidophilus DSM 10332]